MIRLWLLGCLAVLTLACGSNPGSGVDANGNGGDGDGSIGEGDGGIGIDAPPFGGMCTPTSSYECSDCIDNDGDTLIDGFDPQCSSPRDNREDSFATGIPGDNIDATWQDCFFDGNSGHGDDGCNQHVCCLLQAPDKASCPISRNQYDPAKCYKPFGTVDVPQKCIDVCGGLTTPGCDCFGCCTVCVNNDCRDIIINPAVSPNCTQDNVTDPGPDGVDNTGDEPCRRCVKNTLCGNTECGGSTCILCPGQDPSTLPASCGGTSACPTGITPCDANGQCAEAGTYCSIGCCVGTIF
jgi:hypothetical protein